LEKTNLPVEREGDKPMIKTASGKVYLVGNTLKTLSAYRGNKILWTTDIGKCFTSPVPGKNEIRSIHLHDSLICFIW
jgi:hypothetical protein